MAIDLVRKVAARLAGGMERVAGVAVVYRRGVIAREITATPGRTEFQTQEADGAIVTHESRDWLIRREVIESVFGEPQPGDEIDEPDHGSLGTGHNGRITYRVLPMPDGRCFRQMDQTRVYLRVYSVKK